MRLKSILFAVVFFFAVLPVVYAEPKITIRNQNYQIQGNSADELRQFMQRSSSHPGHFGYTEWNINWNYKSGQKGGGCGITSYTVTMDVIYHMPEWSGWSIERTVTSSATMPRKATVIDGVL